jgi:hypothetical protein
MEKCEMKTPIFLVVICLLGACSHQARKVDCEEHLTAINPPTPVVKSAATPTAPATATKAENP